MNQSFPPVYRQKERISEARSKPVLQFSLDGILIGEYASIKGAAQDSGMSDPTIRRSLYSGKPKLGYLWKYKNAVPEFVEEK